jgi:glycyl-tRNA synthetase alpha subunit
MKEGEPPMPKPKPSLETNQKLTEAELKSETLDSLNKNKNTAAETVQLQPNKIAAAESTLNYFNNSAYTYTYVYSKKIIENSNYILHFRVPKEYYEMYHSLSRERKALIKALLMKDIEAVVKGDLSHVKFEFANVNVAISSPIQIQYVTVEKQGVRELKEKLRKYEDFEKCVRAVLFQKFLNWDKQLQLCFEKLK